MADAGIRMPVTVTLEGLERLEVALAILDERRHQDSRWGGRAHDDGHTLQEWVRFIGDATGKAQRILRASLQRVDARASGVSRLAVVAVLDELRQVAALAVAAMESQVRQGQRVRSRSEQLGIRAAEERAALHAQVGHPAMRIDPEVFLRPSKGPTVPSRTRKPARRTRRPR